MLTIWYLVNYSVLAEMYGIRRSSASLIIHGSIVSSRRIDILMAENIRDQINVAGLSVKRRTICTA